MKSLNIIFRSCAVVSALSIGKRPFNIDKRSLILKSLKSLLDSSSRSKARITIDIIDDASEEEFIENMERILKKYRFKYKIHKLNFKNNGKSLEYCYNVASKSKSEIIYFCEDDYIHLDDAIPFIMEAYEEKIIGSSNFGVHPADDPKKYVFLYPSYLFAGRNCHWRSITDTTGTFFLPKKIFDKYRTIINELAEYNIKGLGGEVETIGKMWKEIPCISPIKSLAAHFDNENTLPPFINWKRIIDNIKID